MKKLLFLLFLLPVLVTAQSRFETSAKSTVDKMTAVLSLNAADAAKVLPLEIKKNEDVGKIRTEGVDVRPKVVARMTTYTAELESILGKENSDKWDAYLKEEKAKK